MSVLEWILYPTLAVAVLVYGFIVIRKAIRRKKGLEKPKDDEE